MSNIHLSNLNTDQLDVVNCIASPDISSICIVAGAGVGKTKTMVAGILQLVLCHNVLPEEIFVTTFTRNASSELIERLSEHLTIDQVKKMTIGTFHAIACAYFTDNEQYVEDNVESYLYMFKEYLDTITTKWKYIFIDEYQDINEIQEDIIKTISKNAKMLVVVGDDQQNIYTFRGTKIDYILSFTERYGSEKQKSVLKFLVKNYRCNRCFIGLANIVLSYNTNKLDKELVAMKSNKSSKVKIVGCIDQKTQLHDIVQFITSVANEGKPLHKIAIISRTNSVIKTLEQHLAIHGISSFYIESNNDSLFDHQSIHSINNRVILSTMHGTKGLEFDNVYIIDVNAGTFPSSKCTDIEEERRLFYVSITRAMSKLTICYDERKPSIFINEILEHPDSSKYIVRKSQSDSNNIGIISSKSFPEIKDYSIKNIVQNFEFDDFIQFKENIFDYSSWEPWTEQMHESMPFFSDLHTKRNILVTSMDGIFKNFIETYITRTIQHINNQQIEDINYIIFALKWSDSGIEDLKKDKFIRDIDCVFDLNLSEKTEDEINNLMLYYHSGIKMMSYIDKYHKEKFIESYGRYKSNVPSNTVIFDIFIISLIRVIIFEGRTSIMHAINFETEKKSNKINKSDIFEYIKWFKDVEISLETYFHSVQYTNIHQLTYDRETHVKSISDVSFDSTVMMIVPSRNKKSHICDLIRAIGDLSLQHKSGNTQTYCAIYNPITGYIYTWDLSEWTGHDDMIFYLTERFT